MTPALRETLEQASALALQVTLDAAEAALHRAQCPEGWACVEGDDDEH